MNQGVFYEKYKIGKHLGSGAFGSVNLCSLKDQIGVVRAVKQVRKSDSVIDKGKFLQEMDMLRKVSHPNVL